MQVIKKKKNLISIQFRSANAVFPAMNAVRI